ncbi:hypothetical protein D3C80_1186490 [compost metagenome]
MPFRYQYGVVPAVVGKRRQRLITHQPFTGNADIGFARGQHANDFLGAALIQHHSHPWIQRAELFDHPRQAIARLGMGSGNVQLTCVVAAEYVRQTADIIGIIQDAFCHHQQLFARLGHA